MAQEPGEEIGTLKAFWSGVVTLGLLSVPVSVFPATRRTPLRLPMVDAQGSFLERRCFVADDRAPLDAEDLVRGYEVAKDSFVTVEDDELEALDPEKSRKIDLAQFVALHALSPLHFERAYFLVPDGGTTKAYRLLAESLAQEERAGIATFVMRGKLRARAAPASHTSKPAAVRAGKLESKSKAALYEMAQSMAIPGRSSMSKAKLIDALAHQTR